MNTVDANNTPLNGMLKCFGGRNGKTLRAIYFYKNGLRHGLYFHWYENGKPWKKGSYIEGKKFGPFFEWRESGELDTISIYENDELKTLHYAIGNQKNHYDYQLKLFESVLEP